MAEIIKMPKMSDTMTEGVIAAWHKKVGDKVKPMELVAEIETDKATMDFEIPIDDEATLLYIGAKEKEAMPVDGILAIVGKAGEDFSALLSGGGAGASKKEETAEVKTEEAAPKAGDVDVSDVKAQIIRMPKMSDTMTEGVIAAWHKKVGDKVKPMELVAEIETDKATMDFEIPIDDEATLLYIGGEAGKSIPVDGVLAIVGEKGADFQKLLSGGGAPKKQAPAQKEKEAPAAESKPAANGAVQANNDSRVKISPLAKKMAEEKGLKITDIPGTGPEGRVVKRDIENFKGAAAPAGKAASSSPVSAAQPGVESYTEEPVTQMRKTIARRLSESLYTAPHFYVTMDIDMDKAIEARKSMNDFSGGKISFNDMVLKAVAVALRKHPKINSSWLGDKIRYNNHIHIGVAVAVEEGLLVPVIRFTDSKSLSQISSEVKELAKKATEKKLQPKEWEGNTFTVSNLGMFGVEEFTAIINSPDTCILAVGGIKQVPVVKNGAVVPGNVMKVTLSCDHRVVDGAMGAAFLVTLKQLLEEPVRLLI